jgi:hypothetical protein
MANEGRDMMVSLLYEKFVDLLVMLLVPGLAFPLLLLLFLLIKPNSKMRL